MQRKAIIIGATGLVGQKLLKQLSTLYDTLIVIARRPPKFINSSMRFYQLNTFERLAELMSSIDIGVDTDAFTCLGTTKKQAGGEEAFYQVDFTYNLIFAKQCLKQGVKNFFLLSSMGADSQSRFFYYRVKGEIEASVEQLGFRHLVIFRPSLLLGKHKGRPIESLTQKAFRILSPIVPESLSAYPISAKRVAIAMAMKAHEIYEQSRFRQDMSAKVHIISNQQMLNMTKIKP